jgi:hypothetical protein
MAMCRSNTEPRRYAMTDDTKSCSVPRDPRAVWNDILDLVADDDAQTGESSEQVKQWSRQLDVQIKSRVAELRRSLTPTDVEIKRDVTIPPEVLAMGRDALVAQLESLRQSGVVSIQHLRLTGLNDQSLRTALVIGMEMQKQRSKG